MHAPAERVNYSDPRQIVCRAFAELRKTFPEPTAPQRRIDVPKTRMEILTLREDHPDLTAMKRLYDERAVTTETLRRWAVEKDDTCIAESMAQGRRMLESWDPPKQERKKLDEMYREQYGDELHFESIPEQMVADASRERHKERTGGYYYAFGQYFNEELCGWITMHVPPAKLSWNERFVQTFAQRYLEQPKHVQFVDTAWNLHLMKQNLGKTIFIDTIITQSARACAKLLLDALDYLESKKGQYAIPFEQVLIWHAESIQAWPDGDNPAAATNPGMDEFCQNLSMRKVGVIVGDPIARLDPSNGEIYAGTTTWEIRQRGVERMKQLLRQRYNVTAGTAA